MLGLIAPTPHGAPTVQNDLCFRIVDGSYAGQFLRLSLLLHCLTSIIVVILNARFSFVGDSGGIIVHQDDLLDLIAGETIILVAVTFILFLLLVHRALLSITRLSLVLTLLSLSLPLHF